MILAYLPRLLCVVLACFCLVYTGASILVISCARLAVTRAAQAPAGAAARLMFTLRSLPFASALAAAAVCVPSYLWFEPTGIDESVGMPCLILAFSGAIEFAAGVGIMSRAAFRSWRFLRDCRESGRGDEMLIIDSPRPFVALAGVVRPRVVASQGIVDLLSDDELRMVLEHEQAHRKSRDNLKRLLAALNPAFPRLERAWARFAEFDADERAVAGDQHRALALASALVRVARFGQQPIAPGAVSFLGEISDLPVRVERLLAPQALATASARSPWRGIVVALGIAVLTLNVAAMGLVQSVMESLIR
jgi:Zn-dependent protease with chaperone function